MAYNYVTSPIKSGIINCKFVTNCLQNRCTIDKKEDDWKQKRVCNRHDGVLGVYMQVHGHIIWLYIASMQWNSQVFKHFQFILQDSKLQGSLYCKKGWQFWQFFVWSDMNMPCTAPHCLWDHLVNKQHWIILLTCGTDSAGQYEVL